MLGWMALVLGVSGYVVGMRRSRRNDELARGLLLWVVLAWLGVAVLVGAKVA